MNLLILILTPSLSQKGTVARKCNRAKDKH